jgi:hypothetical protein
MTLTQIHEHLVSLVNDSIELVLNTVQHMSALRVTTEVQHT